MQSATLQRGVAAGLMGGALLYLADRVESSLAGRTLPFHPEQIAARWLGLSDHAASVAGLMMRALYAPAWGVGFLLLRRSVARPIVATPARFAALICSVELLTMPRLNLVPSLGAWRSTTFAWLGLHAFIFAKSQTVLAAIDTRSRPDEAVSSCRLSTASGFRYC